MLYQNLIGTIIGSAIATTGSVLAWVFIEISKKFRDKRKLNNNIRLLYREFEKGTIEPYIAIRIANLIDEIGEKNILTILKFTLHDEDEVYVLVSTEFIIQIMYKDLYNTIIIKYGALEYHYDNPNKNQTCLNKFLEFYRDQCDKEKIKLK